MKLYPLFSSSKGNCTYIGNSSFGLLVDCGVSYRKLQGALLDNSLDIGKIRAVLITHEHTDHTKGLRMLTRHHAIPVYATPRTLDVLYDRGDIGSSAVPAEGTFSIGEALINPFPVPHDAVSPCGYRIDFEECACGVCTDTGKVTDRMVESLRGVNAALIEANYDSQMLKNGFYPKEIKDRLSSGMGHLSNRQCGEFAAQLIKSGTSQIVLGHMSENNNTPEYAMAGVTAVLTREGLESGRDYMLSLASQMYGKYISF